MSFSKQELADAVFYPSSDGKSMAENTRQLQWIVMLYTNIRAQAEAELAALKAQLAELEGDNSTPDK